MALMVFMNLKDLMVFIRENIPAVADDVLFLYLIF